MAKALYYFSVFMVFLYIGFGLLLFFSDTFAGMEPGNRKVLACIIFAYAIFKAIRVYQQRNSFRKLPENEN